MFVEIINVRMDRVIFETGNICQPIKFLPLNNESFKDDYILKIQEYRSCQTIQISNLTLNHLAEILDSLQRVIIKLPIEVKNEH